MTCWHRNRINGRRLGTARPFPLWRLHSGPQSIVRRSIFGNAPRTSGINCSRGDAQIGGYPPLPLKKNWTPKWGVCRVVGVLLVIAPYGCPLLSRCAGGGTFSARRLTSGAL